MTLQNLSCLDDLTSQDILAPRMTENKLFSENEALVDQIDFWLWALKHFETL